ncbi:MAG: bifunctional phosphopantothenoylcysteine decarboxylase/phosphopantothenate--cysteine ligase CoaBC [Gaiellales bacterium]
MIIVGVCGGIAAYKACELVRLLVTGGHDVQVIQTSTAMEFVGPTTFAALSRRPVLTDDGGDPFPHLDTSGTAQVMVIAPLTATTLSRLAHGEAANLLTASALSFTGPLVVAPAMNPRMWNAQPTRANLELLAARGAEVIGPGVGDTAEGEQGEGRMAEPAEIAAAVEQRLAVASSLAGVRVLVTAGGTREPLDSVRFIGNRSSGRMGVAVADEAARRGAEVTLVLAAASARPSAPMRVLEAPTAADMERVTLTEAGSADVIVMSAAVADYRPAEITAGKRSKTGEPWHIELVATTDILTCLGDRRRPGQVLVGFAAEHGDGAVERARAKLERKRVDMIVVNDISRPDIGFDVDLNEVTMVTGETTTHIGRRPKRECAMALWDAVSTMVETQSAASAV